MATLYPYLFCQDARLQADFYTQALGGELLSVQTYDEMPDPQPELEGRVMHLAVQVAGIQLFMADSLKATIQGGSQMDLVLAYSTKEEAKQAFNGLADGGEVMMPFDKMFWGAYFGRLQDRFGVRWQISAEE